MLNQIDIDKLQLLIQGGNKPELYYVAHKVETREGVIEESSFKSVSDFRVMKIKITEITNAYFEVLEYKKNPANYHIETEIELVDLNIEKRFYYIVPNTAGTYTKPVNPAIPSAIYGVVKSDSEVCESPVLPIYTNVLECGDLNNGVVKTLYDSGNLNWKYLTLVNKAIVDGIEYKYVTSDWYIIKCEDFARTEHILINVKERSAYFMNSADAFDFLKECKS